LAHAPDYIMVVDRNDTIQFMNRAAPGYTIEKVVGTNLYDYVAPQAKTEHRRMLASAFKTGQVRSIDVPVLDADGGTSLWFEVRFVPLKEGTETTSVMVIGTDITRRKEAERELVQALNAKETLLHELHHRVKNNLQVVSGLLHLQSASAKDKRLADILNDSVNRIDIIATLHEKLHKSENIEGVGSAEYIADIAAGVFGSFGIERASVGLRLEIEDICLGIGDALSYGLIVNELVSNSLKHAFPGDRTGEIGIAFGLAGEQDLELTVSDNGVGLPKDLDFMETGSLGFKLIRGLVCQLNGNLKLDRSEGTKIIVRFKGKAGGEAGGAGKSQ